MSDEATLDEFMQNKSSNKDTKWDTYSLGELADYHNGRAFDKSEWGNNGYPIIRIQNLTDGDSEFNYFDGELSEEYRIEQNDTLLSWSATIDVFKWDGPDAALNQHIFKVDPNHLVNNIYFRYNLQDLLPQLNALSQGSTMKHLRRPDLVNSETYVAPLSEQRKIATVLYTVDRAIEKTKEVIDRTARVQEGLQQELFRDWGDDNKDDPLAGRYPADWKLETLSDVVTVTDAEHFTPEYVESGIPVLRPGDLEPGRISLESVEKRVEEGTYEELTNRHTPSNEDIVYSRSQNFAVASQVMEDEPYCLGQDMVVIEPESLDGTFLLHILNSPVIRNQAIRRSTGSTFSRVNLGDIRSFKLPIPSKEVQQEIAEIITGVEERIRIEQKIQSRLHRLKRGLMQDLLSGTVRTTDTNIEVPDEIAQYG